MNPSERDKYRERLLEMQDRLLGEVNSMGEDIRETVRKPGENSALPTHPGDQDSEGLDAELSMMGSQRDVLKAVEDALIRINEGSYGACVDCGREIAGERLDLLPYTPYCAECAHRHEREEEVVG